MFEHPEALVIASSFNPSNFSYSLLILFSAIFGWEIIGNYSGEAIEPKKTITKAIFISILAISVVDLVVAAAIQWTDSSPLGNGEFTITVIIHTLFRNMSNLVMAILALFLCCSTYFLYAGGIARLISSLALEKVLPPILSKRSNNDVPYLSVNLLFEILIALLWMPGIC